MIQIDGRTMASDILDSVKKEVLKLPFRPLFCDVLVGDDPASIQYVQMKERRAKTVGMDVHSAVYPESITTEELVLEIEKINQLPHMCGLIVQLPLPEHIDTDRVLNTINPAMDVDVLGKENTNLFYNSTPHFIFPTAQAVLHVFDTIKENTHMSDEAKIVVIGKGKLVGHPVSFLLEKMGYDVSVIDRDTENPDEILLSADVIISAAGQQGIVHGGNIKPGVVIIDAGTSEANGSIVGDVDKESVVKIATYLSPTPGGVGPLTVAMLFKNVLLASQNKKR